MKENRQPESPSLKKVVFLLNSSDWHGSNSETLWAAPMGSNLYRLENTPFFALDVSYQDVVLACEEKDGVAQFVQVFSRGGHSTYRVLITASTAERLDELWAPLKEAGCTYEEGPRHLLAVDVPPTSDIHQVYRLLQAGEEAGFWSFEEGHCGHAVG